MSFNNLLKTGYRYAPVSALCLSVAFVDAEEVIPVPDVVVSATRSEQSTVTIPASITIISREHIEQSGARHIAELLRGQGGIQISDPFGDGSRTSVGMRGFGETANANTLILVDGRRLNNIDIGVPDLNSISLKDVKRIEIIQGSAGTLFGDQAVGGIINIITETPEALHAFAEAGLGSYNGYDFRAGVSHLLDNGFSYRLTLEKKETDNYRDHNELDYENLAARFGYEHASGSILIEGQHVDERLNTPAALFAAEVAADRRQVAADFVNDFSNTETTVLRVGGEQVLSDNWSFAAELTNRESRNRLRAELPRLSRYALEFPEPAPAELQPAFHRRVSHRERGHVVHLWL